SVRHLTVPEPLWGTWAPSADLCRDSKATFVVSAKGTRRRKRAARFNGSTAGADGPIYSAHMRCSSRPEPPETTDEDRVIVSNARGDFGAGPEVKHLRRYRLGPPN